MFGGSRLHGTEAGPGLPSNDVLILSDGILTVIEAIYIHNVLNYRVIILRKHPIKTS